MLIKQIGIVELSIYLKNLYITANDAGYFKEEIAPVQVKVKKQDATVNVDEHPRIQTTLETLAKLKPVFQKDGLVTAGSASVQIVFFFLFYKGKFYPLYI